MENNFNKIQLGLNIKHLRKQKKLSQGELCAVIGVKVTTLSNWEVGLAVPDIQNIVLISKYFGISLDNLVLKPPNDWHDPPISIIDKNCMACREKEALVEALRISVSSTTELNAMLREKLKSTVSNGHTQGPRNYTTAAES